MCAAKSLRVLSPSPRASFGKSQAEHRKKFLQVTPTVRKELRRCALSKGLEDSNCWQSSFRGLQSLNKELKLPYAGSSRTGISPVQSMPISTSSSLLKSPTTWTEDGDECLSSNAVHRFGALLSVSDCLSPDDHSQNSGQTFFSPLYTPDRNEQFLGRGSFGNVSLCQYRRHRFAVKIVDRYASFPVGENNFLGVKHENLVRILRVTEVMNRVIICMEFAGHCNLQQLLENKGDLDFGKKLSFVQQVASGLNHCHKLGVIHGDVKPANIIISPFGECKLGDFGLSIRTSEADKISNLRGTAAYVSPEVFKGEKISTATDIYAFGIMLWQIYSNKMPFAGQHPHIIIYKVVRQNARPEFEMTENEDMLQYSTLAKLCWERQPQARPSSEYLLSHLKQLPKRSAQ